MGGSVGAGPIAPRGIAGGFVLVPVRPLLSTWGACQRDPLGVGDFRTWLACHEILARRCTLEEGRSPTYGYSELSRLTGVSEKRARSSVNRLIGAGLLAWSDRALGFPGPGPGSASEAGDDTLADSIGGGEGSLAIPRRILRFLAGGARPALIATVLGILLRCLSRGRGGFKSRGRVKAAWVARVFDVDLRRVKAARKELIDLGWLVPEDSDQWAMNRWGATYHVDLAWGRAAVEDGPRLPPPPAPGGRRLPPPDSDPEPLREHKNQEPDSGGPAGVQVREGAGGRIPPPTLRAPSTDPVVAAPVPSVARNLGPGRPRPAPVTDESGTSPPGAGSRRPVSPRPATAADGAGGAPLPPPNLDDVRVEDLKDTGRLIGLLDRAIARDLVGPSEADRLRFVAAAEHALASGKENPPGLFMYLVRGRRWRYLTQEDEDRANARIKRELRGEPPSRSGVGTGAAWGRPVLSADALVVREVRAALIRAGTFRDPFAAFQRLNPDWTRERWDAAMRESEMAWLMPGRSEGAGSPRVPGLAFPIE
jgi:hypothetical protein